MTVLRALADRGIAGALPDLPGQGESMMPTHATDLPTLRAGFAAAVASRSGPAFALAIRSGALLDGDAEVAGRYHLSPTTGAELARELARIGQAAAREAGEPFDAAGLNAARAPVELAGNRIAPALLAQLRDAMPSSRASRTMRLTRETKPGDATIAGPPLWRRAEPGNDPDFARAVADDIATWIATCAG
ncbi:hypothetical protein [Sphingomonas sp.]|uniref:hypothetical protein n=1 Tax=Sphingomonas sp. TaxID=28214 RepID=UPI0025D1BF69|nr:hypothetical protein [Sphingomonas sp.]